MTQTFTYSEYQTDYITKYLRDYEEQIPDWFKTYLTGDSSLEQNRDDDIEDYLSQTTYVPAMGVIRGVAENIPDSVGTAATFEGIDFQSTSVFDWVLSDPTKITTQNQGIVLVVANDTFAASAGGVLRAAAIYQNGAIISNQGTPPFGGGTVAPTSISIMANADAGDYFQLFLYQDSGAPLGAISKLQIAYLGLNGG